MRLLGFGTVPAVRGLLGGVLGYGIFLAILAGTAAAVGYVFGMPAMMAAARRVLVAGPGAPVYALMAIAAAPIAEETIFRGYVYAGLRRAMAGGPAMLLSAAMFASVHLGFSVPALLGLTMLAVALAYAYERTRCLWVPIGMHACHNALVFAFLLLHSL